MQQFSSANFGQLETRSLRWMEDFRKADQSPRVSRPANVQIGVLNLKGSMDPPDVAVALAGVLQGKRRRRIGGQGFEGDRLIQMPPPQRRAGFGERPL